VYYVHQHQLSGICVWSLGISCSLIVA
jgi:hypothetical protein